jgi:ABC-type transporter Mla subunit MlaD
VKLERDDAKIGLLVFLALALFLGVIFQRSLSAILRKEFRVKVDLESAENVEVGTAVQLQGLQVGAVKDIQLQRDGVRYRFLATLGLRSDILLWTGTRAQVVAKPLGGSFVDLILPPAQARAAILPPASVIPGAPGASLGAVLESVHRLVNDLDQGVAEVRSHLRQEGLGALLDHPQVSRTLGDLRSTLGAYGRLAEDGRVLVRHGDASLRTADQGLASLDRSLASVRKLLEDRSGDLDAALRHLAATLRELEAFSKELAPLIRKAGPGAEGSVKALERDLRSLEELLEILKAKPNRVIWGKPSPAEREAASRKVQEARQAQEDGRAQETPGL